MARHFYWTKVCVGTVLLAAYGFVCIPNVFAATSNWIGSGSDFNTAGNWDSGVPTDIAGFNTSTPRSISLSASNVLNGFTFNSGASAYTITLPLQLGLTLSLNGAGIINNSSNVQTLTTNGGSIAFNNSATAGNTAINNNALGAGGLNFNNTSTAGNATITVNDGVTTFQNSSSAGNSTINNATLGILVFQNGSTAANATITNTNSCTTWFKDTSSAANATISTIGNSATVYFYDSSTGGNARFITNGLLDISNLTTAGITAGSLEGTGGVTLGSKSLTVGSNNLSTEFSGTIGDFNGSGGSLVKVGAGTLILSGRNFYTGGTTINGGTLRTGTANALPSGGNVTLANTAGVSLDLAGFSQTIGALSGGGTIGGNIVLGTATLTVGQGNTTSGYSGSISGNGSLVKTGTGSLQLNGINTYTGVTRISQGTLLGGAGPANSLSSASAIVFDDVAGATLDLNNQNQTVGSIAGGGNIGGTIATLTANLTVGGDNTSTTYAGDITGGGSLIKMGTGTLTLSRTAVQVLNTTVNAGTVNVTGTLPFDTMRVASHGTLTGTGSVGTVINNGAVTPGASGVGTLTIGTYSGSGVLNILFNRGPSNVLHTTGSATLTGGILNVTGTNFMSGNYKVITGGAVVGTFDTVNIPPDTAFLKFSTQYNPQDVTITINRLGFATIAQTGNQRSLGAALDVAPFNNGGGQAASVNTGLPQVLDAISRLSVTQAQSAYDQLSGDGLASFQSLGLRTAALFTHQMNNQTGPTNLTETARLSSPIELAYNGDAGDLRGLGSVSTSHGLWARGIGLFDRTDGDTSLGSPSSRADTGGFQMGYEYPIDDRISIGISGGYAKTSLTVDDRTSSGNSKAIEGGVYAHYAPSALFLNASAAYVDNSNDMTRTINFPGISGQADSSFKSHVYVGFVEVGYTIKPLASFTLQPSVSLRHSHLHQDGYTESGAPGLNLNVQDESVDSTVSSCGTRLSRLFFRQTSHEISLGARGAWEHELGDVDNLLSAQFADAPGAVFSVKGTPRNRDSAVFGLDARAALTKSLQAFVDYSTALSSDQRTQTILGGLSLKW